MKTFDDIRKLGMTEPTVYAYLNYLESGSMTKEQALIGMVITLAEQKRDVADNYMKHMERCATPSFGG